MRTSFHHQPEAQHPNSSAIHKLAGRLPHLWSALRTQVGHRDMSEKCHVWTAPSWQGLSPRPARDEGFAAWDPRGLLDHCVERTFIAGRERLPSSPSFQERSSVFREG